MVEYYVAINIIYIYIPSVSLKLKVLFMRVCRYTSIFVAALTVDHNRTMEIWYINVVFPARGLLKFYEPRT